MADVTALLDLADLAHARADGVVSEERLEGLDAICRRMRTRNGFLGEVLVVALAGGTGGGKSSIINALVGQQVVGTSVLRPTTDAATAIVPADATADLGPMLAALDVGARIDIEGWHDIVLVDLPDFDSTVEAHRAIVDGVLPTVDAVIWVLDPEKYADPVLHDEFLGNLTDHESQFVFVLNQADRLGEDVDDVVASLRAMLIDDGFEAPSVISSIAATRSEHTAVDVSAIASTIEDRFDTKTTAMSKLAIDVRRMASETWRAIAAAADGIEDRDTAALAAATFVWLGVDAYQLQWELDRGSAGVR